MVKVLAEDSTLQEIVARLVSAVDPQRIILFGSRAEGRSHYGSDYDILIVKDEPDPAKRRTGRLHKHLWGIPQPVDLLWYTPEEMAAWADVPQHVVGQAAQRGIVLYER